jgi:hypothetical protein
MTPQEKDALIDRFLAGADAFDDVLTLSPALLTFRPAVDAWTIHEHVVHFVDSEIATFHRYRKAIAEPGGMVVGYDEDRWTPALNYHATSLADALALLKLLRRITAAHLRTIATRDWTALWFQHSSAGPVNLEAWIASYIDHVRFHREYIERNKTLYSQK